jgi:hypothetical protein
MQGADAASEVASDRLAQAIVTRAAGLFSVANKFDPAVLDLQLLGGEAIEIGGHVLDSLDFVELMVALQEDLDVSLLDIEDMEQVGTLRGLAQLIVESGPTARLAEFCERWDPSSG